MERGFAFLEMYVALRFAQYPRAAATELPLTPEFTTRRDGSADLEDAA